MFEGACDASGAVPLDDRHFAVADDEDSVLRVYDAWAGGPPTARVDVTDALGLEKKKKGKKGKKGKKDDEAKPRKSLESDIEAATRLEDAAFFLTSHARKKSGEHDPNRFRFFATDIPEPGHEPSMLGSTHVLLDDMLADERLLAFGLERASTLPAKAPGSLNIEGMTATLEGSLLIGFRSPQPGGKALVVTLLNPRSVLDGQRAEFAAPELLDLGGLGVRALSSWHGMYLIVAGATASEQVSALYLWDRSTAPRKVDGLELGDLNPEGFFTPEQGGEMLLLSDDGDRELGDKACKDLKDASQKRFRGVRLALPALGLPGQATPR